MAAANAATQIGDLMSVLPALPRRRLVPGRSPNNHGITVPAYSPGKGSYPSPRHGLLYSAGSPADGLPMVEVGDERSVRARGRGVNRCRGHRTQRTVPADCDGVCYKVERRPKGRRSSQRVEACRPSTRGRCPLSKGPRPTLQASMRVTHARRGGIHAPLRFPYPASTRTLQRRSPTAVRRARARQASPRVGNRRLRPRLDRVCRRGAPGARPHEVTDDAQVVKRIIIGPTLAAILAAGAAEAHIPEHCASNDVYAAATEKVGIFRALQGAQRRGNTEALIELLRQYLDADDRLSKAMTLWVQCIGDER